MPKAKKVQKSKPVLKGEPKFFYTSKCHNVRATKVPLLMPDGRAISHLGQAPNPEGQAEGMGKFRCSECNKPCVCIRTRNEPKKETPVESAGE